MSEPDDTTTTVEIYRVDAVRLRMAQIEMAGEDGKVPPLKDVVRRVLDEREE